MLIQVIYQDDKRFGAVHKFRLDHLIRSGRLFAFRRVTGWVILENDPLRGQGGSYTGPERRSRASCVDASLCVERDPVRQDISEVSKYEALESECLKILESYNDN